MEPKLDRPLQILLAEDNHADVVLVQEILKEQQVLCDLSVARDGEEASQFLHRTGDYADAPRPDFVILDLNMPRKSGREVLREIKSDDDLKVIPVIILTSSKADEDVTQSYRDHANCYIAKPGDFHEYMKIVEWIRRFWFTITELPAGQE